MKAKNLKSTTNQFSMDDFIKALDAEEYHFTKGEIVRGKIFSHDTNGIYVDLGAKSLAFVPAEEITADLTADLAALLPIGEEADFLIIAEQNADGQITLSCKQLQMRYAWDNITEHQSNKDSVQVRVTGVNKGGVTTDYQGLRGFIPRSQLSEKDLNSLVGTNITVSIIEANQDTKKLVFSQRQAAKTANFAQLELGQLIVGKVVGIKPFGVFVEFDGNTGLLPIKQVSQKFVADANQIFAVNQEIKAMIITLDEGSSRISLSTRILENHPGEMLENMAEIMESAEARSQRAAKQLFGQ